MSFRIAGSNLAGKSLSDGPLIRSGHAGNALHRHWNADRRHAALISGIAGIRDADTRPPSAKRGSRLSLEP